MTERTLVKAAWRSCGWSRDGDVFRLGFDTDAGVVDLVLGPAEAQAVEQVLREWLAERARSLIDSEKEREGAGEAIRAGMIEVSASNVGSEAAPLPVGSEWRDVMRDRFSKEKVAVSPPRYLRQILRELWMAVRRQ